MKKHISKKIVQMLLLSFTSAALVSCMTAAPEPETGALTTQGESQVVYVEGVPGGVVTNVEQLSATVSAIDYAARKVTLVDGEGQKQTMQTGPEARNFNQIMVGDLVKVTVVEETVVFLREKGAAAKKDGAAGLAARTPKGEKPGMLVASTAEVTAVVKSVDIPNHKATLQFADGSTRVVTVRKDVEVTPDKVGREVVIRLTEAIAISVEKP